MPDPPGKSLLTHQTRFVGFGVLCLLASIGASDVAGQTVRGVLKEAGTGTAIEGAMVLLIDEAGATRYQVLTDVRGGFVMERQPPGRYTLRADRIGHASTVHPTFTVPSTGTVELEMFAQVEAITLEGIEVEADGRCSLRGEEGRQVATVWEEVRKALAAASWTGSHGVFRYELAHITRELDRDARLVTDQQVRYERTSRQRTFVSRPAEELIEGGFVTSDDEGQLYLGPDADVLLSDAFLSTHCFRLRERREDGLDLIGLQFEPLRGRRLPEVSGTLWLDRTTSALQVLEWRYENLDPNLDTEHVGGMVEFTALPSGPWIIRKWWIRMPMIGFDRRSQRRGRSLVGIREVGAQVRRISTATGNVVVEFEGSVIQGVVRGGYEGRRLTNAMVSVQGSGERARTGRRGQYRLLTPDGGTYAVSFTHPYLDSLGYVVPDTLVTVDAQGIAELDLRAPTPFEIIEDRCGEEAMLEGTAVVMGRLLAADSVSPLPEATIQFDWTGFEVPLEGMILERGQGVQITTDNRGFFSVCTIPANTPLRIKIEWPGGEHPATLRIPSGSWRWHYDFVAPPAAGPGEPR